MEQFLEQHHETLSRAFLAAGLGLLLITWLGVKYVVLVILVLMLYYLFSTIHLQPVMRALQYKLNAPFRKLRRGRRSVGRGGGSGRGSGSGSDSDSGSDSGSDSDSASDSGSYSDSDSYSDRGYDQKKSAALRPSPPRRPSPRHTPTPPKWSKATAANDERLTQVNLIDPISDEEIGANTPVLVDATLRNAQ